MKKMVKASAGDDKAIAMQKARLIKTKAQELLDAMEMTPEGFLEANDLMQLYDELIDTIPALDFAINSDGIEY